MKKQNSKKKMYVYNTHNVTHSFMRKYEVEEKQCLYKVNVSKFDKLLLKLQSNMYVHICTYICTCAWYIYQIF